MIITLKTTATEAEVTKLRNELEAKGLVIHPVEGAHYNMVLSAIQHPLIPVKLNPLIS